MSIAIKEIIKKLNQWAPLSLQESYDNAGVQIGNDNQVCNGAMICLDITEEIIQEAIEKGCNLIISHHPLIFKGLKNITGETYVERCIITAIQNHIVLYSSHTNLDSVYHGVNHKIAEKIGLKDLNILSPRPSSLLKLYTFVPVKEKDKVLNALFDAGAGNIGQYSECSFVSSGSGSFKPSLESQPTIGKAGGERENVEEFKIEVIVPFYAKHQIIHALKEAHPYEDVAYELIPILNDQNDYGFGMIGELINPQPLDLFLRDIQEKFSIPSIKHTSSSKKDIIRTVAVCGGSGSFLIDAAKAAKADIYITGDLKYHEFFLGENDLILADIGHFESEQFTIELIYNFLQKKFPKFALHATSINTNPVKYFI